MLVGKELFSRHATRGKRNVTKSVLMKMGSHWWSGQNCSMSHQFCKVTVGVGQIIQRTILPIFHFFLVEFFFAAKRNENFYWFGCHDSFPLANIFRHKSLASSLDEKIEIMNHDCLCDNIHTRTKYDWADAVHTKLLQIFSSGRKNRKLNSVPSIFIWQRQKQFSTWHRLWKYSTTV